MDDKELADAVVAILSQFFDWGDLPSQASGRYGAEDWPVPKIAHDFVRDWRVAGALLDTCFDKEIVLAHITDDAMRNMGESLSCAIIEACVKALNPPHQDSKTSPATEI